jgi:Fe-S-cluster containining protein
MQIVPAIEKQYRSLLGQVDAWFNRCLESGGTALSCRGGCSACCRGLFDITLLDALLLKNAFLSLAPATREGVLQRCHPRLAELRQRWPGLQPPYLLNALPDHEWTEMPEDDETPCPLLDAEGFCLVYNSRPLTCRLHGLPNIDSSGEDFEGTTCTLHKGSPLDLPEEILRWRFRDVFNEEIAIFRKFTEQLTGTAYSEIDTFIPLALLADYDNVDWKNLR